jgi:hypothetical protein
MSKRRVKTIVQHKRPPKTEFEAKIVTRMTALEGLEGRLGTLFDSKVEKIEASLVAQFNVSRAAIIKEANEIIDSMREKLFVEVNEIVGKVDTLAKQVASYAAVECGKIGTMNTINAESIDKLDDNILCMANIMKEVFGQLSQIDEMLKLLDLKPDGKPLEERVDPDVIRKAATAWYEDIVADGFRKVQAAKEAASKARQEAREKAAAEAAAAKEKEIAAMAVEKDRTEAAAAQEALNKAEEPSLVPAGAAGPGSDIPEGAEVFGG